MIRVRDLFRSAMSRKLKRSLKMMLALLLLLGIMTCLNTPADADTLVSVNKSGALTKTLGIEKTLTTLNPLQQEPAPISRIVIIIIIVIVIVIIVIIIVIRRRRQ